MRVSAQQTFTKLYAVIEDTTLEKGAVLTIPVDVHYDAMTLFGGEKWIVASESSPMGGRSEVTGWCFIILSFFFLLMAGLIRFRWMAGDAEAINRLAARKQNAPDEHSGADSDGSAVAGASTAAGAAAADGGGDGDKAGKS
jgi:hypothetical protein